MHAARREGGRSWHKTERCRGGRPVGLGRGVVRFVGYVIDLLSDLVSCQSLEERDRTPRLGARSCKDRNSRLNVGACSGQQRVQLRVAEANAQRVVAACEEYHAANGRFPRNLMNSCRNI